MYVYYNPDSDDMLILQDGYAPIHLASIHGHVEVIQKLIWMGVDCNIVSKVSWISYNFQSFFLCL